MRIFCMVLFLAAAKPLFSQNDIVRVWEPAVTYTHRVDDFWSANAQLTAYRSTDRLERVEGSLFGIRRLTPSTSVGAGYLYRSVTPLEETTSWEHRYTLQLTHQRMWGIHQISHRMRADERVRPNGNVHRFRYRIGTRTPLQGERLDPGERYLLLQNEGLASFSDKPFSGENRASAHLGMLLKNRQRVEIGLQHRAERLFTDADVRHVMVLSTVWHFTN